MGVCLCKDKVEDGYSTENNVEDEYSRPESKHSLSERVDALVKETLDVIASIVDDDPEPPNSMTLLHDITGIATGWIQLVKSLIKVVPQEHPMGPSVITLLLDDSPLPSKDSVIEVAEMITQIAASQSTPCERNLCVILGCLAEKLAGPSSIAVLSESTLTYLLNNLKEDTPKDLMLFSLIALEKFAQTSENKATIKRKLALCPENPLLALEKYTDSADFTLRQVGFCARWSLDNYFLIEDRPYSYEKVDTSNINVMLNTKDVSEYLKISADGLEARCDSYSFESVRCTYQVFEGAWYYEVQIITPGVMQIGWATKASHFLSTDGYGIGDDLHSISFDGCRRLIWYNAKSMPINLHAWKGGSIVGCLLDLDAQEVIFSLDGVESAVMKQVFGNSKDGFFAAASFMSFQQCRFNFGSEEFKFPPSRNFNTFNKNAVLKEQDKIVLPRHLFLEALRKMSISKDSCTLCFDLKASKRLIPCQHSGYCGECVQHLERCPLCRASIVATENTPEGEFDDES